MTRRVRSSKFRSLPLHKTIRGKQAKVHLACFVRREQHEIIAKHLKPRLHERFFPRAGDAIFFRFCHVACAPGWLHL